MGFVQDPKTGQRVQAEQEVEIRKVIVDSTAQTPSFKDALKIQSLREKAKSKTNDVELTKEESDVLFQIYRARPTDEKLALIEIIKELNPDFNSEVLP